MSSNTLRDSWTRELGATSRGMLVLDGSFATARSLDAAGPAAGRGAVREEAASARGLLAATLAAALMVVPALALFLGDPPTSARYTGHIVDLPTVTVRPSPLDAAAYRHSRRIVDLEAVVVRPREEDRARFLAAR